MPMSIASYLMTVAKAVASRSTCRRQVGCVLADERGRILATGYNGPASGVPHCDDRGCSGVGCDGGCKASCLEMNCDAVHAEQNAVLQCREPDRVHYMVVTRAPCMTCLRLAMNTSAREVVFMERSSYPEAEEYWTRHRGDGTWRQVVI